MNLETAIDNIDKFLKALETRMPEISDEVALNALGLVKNRIIDQREGIEGAQYSTRPMLATKDQFVVKSAFKITKEDDYIIARNKKGKRIESKSGRSYKTKKVKRELWIKFPNASKAVPVMRLEEGYRELREIQGRPGDHVNGSYSGKMWQATTIVSRVHSGLVWATIIGGNNEEAQDKLMWLTDKYGLFLAVLPDEKEKLEALYQSRMQELVNQNLLHE